MSRFYASISNNRSTITKCGHKDGLFAHIRGWNIGVQVQTRINAEGKDEILVYKTAGSNGSFQSKLIAKFTE